MQLLPQSFAYSKKKIELLGGYGVALLVAIGHYAQAERNLQEVLPLAVEITSTDVAYYILGELGLVSGLQRNYAASDQHFDDSCNAKRKQGRKVWLSGTLGDWGRVKIQQGQLERANEYLQEALQIKRRYADHPGEPKIFIPLAHLAEVQSNWQEAAQHYQHTLDLKTGRLYFENGARVGLVRVHHATADYGTIPTLLAEAESLAQQYEYNDHLASLRLSQGHIAWDGHIPEWGNGFDAAFAFYQQSLIYALRYNRFLLDEVLWGGNITTPLHPIIPHCQQRGDEGRRMLTALRDWWQTGHNDTGAPRAETISLVPEGVSLLEAERIARANEPGDGSPQVSVVDAVGEVVS
jgi:tetratricopeptide (TPR) repeat protein